MAEEKEIRFEIGETLCIVRVRKYDAVKNTPFFCTAYAGVKKGHKLHGLQAAFFKDYMEGIGELDLNYSGRHIWGKKSPVEAEAWYFGFSFWSSFAGAAVETAKKELTQICDQLNAMERTEGEADEQV